MRPRWASLRPPRSRSSAASTIEAVEWLPSGADSGLVRVRGRWSVDRGRAPGPARAGAAGGRDRPSLRVAARRALRPRPGVVARAATSCRSRSWRAEPEALWVEWPGGVRSRPAPLAPGLARAGADAGSVEPESEGGQLIDRGVLAERRARRAEAAEQASGACRGRGPARRRGAGAAVRRAGAPARGDDRRARLARRRGRGSRRRCCRAGRPRRRGRGPRGRCRRAGADRRAPPGGAGRRARTRWPGCAARAASGG